LATFIQPTWQALIDGAMFCDDQLREIIARNRPDVIVEDNVVEFPALTTAGVPFIRIVSCNPLELADPDLPPVFSGYPTGDRAGWAEYQAEYRRTHLEMWTKFNDWVQSRGAAALPELEFIRVSDQANLYVFPAELDYPRTKSIAADWTRMDSSVRRTDEDFEIPAELAAVPAPDGSKLIYLSLGSLGSADVELMRRLVAVLAGTPHRYIVSKGPQHEEIDLAPNMWGAEMVPQTKIIPQVDLVITHGGNNTVTEAMHFGKPMILLPLFWDQYDNAQRVDEAGFGVRLDTYGFADTDLTGAVERLLADTELRDRLATVGERIRANDGLEVAAAVIESVLAKA
jgi:MGT family glycosyltransferase